MVLTGRVNKQIVSGINNLGALSIGFCGIDGGKTIGLRGGQSRKCTKCEVELFPRTDPVIITLVSNGDYCLLGQSKGRLSNLNIYSCSFLF